MALTKATQNVLEGIVSTGSTGVSAGSFVVAQQYKITSLGTTTQLQWNTIAGTTGQTYVVGSLFTAATTGSGSGTGEAAVARTLANRFSDVVNVLDFGADPTGTISSQIAIQNAISAASNGGTVFFPEGTYICTSTLSVENKTTIYGYGATLNFSSGNNATRLGITGAIGSNILLSSNATASNKSINVTSTTGLIAGDLILISSNALVPLASIGGTTTQTIGEFAIIRNISGNTIFIEGALDDNYNTSDSAKIQKITPRDNVSIFGLSIIGKGPLGTDNTTSDIGISARYCKNLTIRDCTIINCDYQAISIDQSYIVNIDNNSTFQAYRGNDAFINVIQYGITMKGASSIIFVQNNSVIGGKHGIVWTENSLPGIGRNCVISSNTITGTWAAAIATHESNEQFTITSNYIAGCARGMDIRVRKGIISNNSIRELGDGSTSDGIYLSLTASDLIIEGNALYKMRYGVRMYNVGLPAGAKPYNVRIINNVISDITQIGIYLEQTQNTGNFRNWVISGNTIRESVGDSIRLNGAFYSPTITNNVIKNFVTGSGYGVKLMGTTRAQIQGNYFENMVPVRLENDDQAIPQAPTFTIMSNNIWDNTGSFVSVSTGSDYIIRFNTETGEITTPIIASGVINIPSGAVEITVDTEGAAATDDLDNITGGTLGDIVIFRSQSSTRDITFKDAIGNMRLAGDFILDNTNDRITLIRTGTGWDEISRSNNT